MLACLLSFAGSTPNDSSISRFPDRASHSAATRRAILPLVVRSRPQNFVTPLKRVAEENRIPLFSLFLTLRFFPLLFAPHHPPHFPATVATLSQRRPRPAACNGLTRSRANLYAAKFIWYPGRALVLSTHFRFRYPRFNSPAASCRRSRTPQRVNIAESISTHVHSCMCAHTHKYVAVHVPRVFLSRRIHTGVYGVFGKPLAWRTSRLEIARFSRR